MLAMESLEGRESRPIIEVAVTGVYGWKADWLTGGMDGMPIGWGAWAEPDLAPVLIKPPRYWAGGFGEVVEETEDES